MVQQRAPGHAGGSTPPVCSYREPIKSCKRENVLCTTREDQVCIECDCNDPIGNWTDIELGMYFE